MISSLNAFVKEQKGQTTMVNYGGVKTLWSREPSLECKNEDKCEVYVRCFVQFLML